MLCRYLFVLKAGSTLFFYTLTLFFFNFYQSLKAQEFYMNLENTVQSDVWLNLHTIDSGYAHSGNYFSMADSVEEFGLGIESIFPEEYRNKNTMLKVEGWVKSSKIQDRASFVISLFDENKQLYWQNFYLSSLFNETETWYSFSDSVKVPASVTKSGRFKVYLWNNDLKDTVAIDDLKISFTEIDNPSFIPLIASEPEIRIVQNRILLFENNFYRIYQFPENESIGIYSLNDSLLINGFSYYLKNDLSKAAHTHHQKFVFKSVRSKNSGIKIGLINNGRFSKITMELHCNFHSPEIRFEVKTKHKKNQLIYQESVIIKSAIPVNEVYRSNRKSDIDSFQDEYWLGRQGVRFGKKSESIIVYQTPELSSLQLNTNENTLWLNLDYEKDHPFLHFPLRNDTADYKLDWSSSKVLRRDKRSYSFSIFAGSKVHSLPRFLKNPDGFLASYIWTEHADFTNLKSNRATYFGSEKVIVPDSSIGGFVKYEIPLTKSVFYTNPEGTTNLEVSNGQFSEPESSIKEDDEYLKFLQLILNKGFEICLHTPENFTTNRSDLEEALQFMQNEFQSPSWIDHGYNNGIQNNREDIVCDGTLKKSDYFAMDLWEKYGVRYFWNPYYEDYFTFEDWKFGALIGKPYKGFGDFFPDPDYWSHPSRTDHLIHWPTKSVLYVPDDWLWEYHFNDMVLNEFISTWGVEINHCYPAWVDPAKGFWVHDADSTIVAAPGLNRTLERMAVLRNEGKLNVITIKDFIDYQLAVEQIKYEILPDGRIKITNNSKAEIKGLSFATKAKYVQVNDQIPDGSRYEDELIFWFDIESKASKLIRMIE